MALAGDVRLRREEQHVAGLAELRRKLLDEARRERERVLQNPGSLLRSPRRSAADVACQTEAPLPPPSPGASARGRPQAAGAGERRASYCWSAEDEEAQAEAIAAIQRMSKGDARLKREALQPWQQPEQRFASSARDQVAILERELDSKELALRDMERALESRDEALEAAHQQVRRLLWHEIEREKDVAPRGEGSDFERIRRLREQVLELEYRLHLREVELCRLSRPAKEQDDPELQAGDEVSTLCGSERSLAQRSQRSSAPSGAWGA